MNTPKRLLITLKVISLISITLSLTACPDVFNSLFPEEINLNVSQIEQNKINLTWNPISKASHYEVFRIDFINEPIKTSVLCGTPFHTSFIDTENIAIGQTLEYYIVAQEYKNGHLRKLTESSPISITIIDTAPEPNAVPRPQNISAILQNDNSVSLSWESSVDNLTFDIFYNKTGYSWIPDSNNYALLNTMPLTTNESTHEISSFYSGEYIYYRIVAYDAAMKASIPSPPIRVRFP